MIMYFELSELRCGNYVKWDRSSERLRPEDEDYLNEPADQNVCVYNINRSYIRVETEIEELDEVMLYPDFIKGIPLTEEILLKSGFIEFKIGEDFYLRKNDFIFEESGVFGFSIFDVDFELLSVNGNKVLKFVHQLQNLYFALTGEELEIIL